MVVACCAASARFAVRSGSAQAAPAWRANSAFIAAATQAMSANACPLAPDANWSIEALDAYIRSTSGPIVAW
jgi:hypothetical protein